MAVRFESNAEPIPGYTLIDRIGSGGFGEVWKAEAPGGIFKAIKIIHGDLRSKDDDLVRYAEQELKALKRVKSVRHPYLLALDRYDVIEGRLLIVMELADCNLWDRFRECRMQGLPGIPREELLQYMAEAGEVLDLMNDRFQLQHLDIKPQNLFLLYHHVKVADFGQVKDLQGLMANVTGGITPVYAAPETFDGFVSRFCDQYSLACVYQELLTGVRPFDGVSMQQLLMQHLQMSPNLAPSPPCDRPSLGRALSKKPEDRFPCVSALVRALRDGRADEPPVSVRTVAAPPPATPPGIATPIALLPADGSSAAMPIDVPRTESPAAGESPPPASAPPERTGDGPLRPAVIIGMGQTGLRVLQRLRKLLNDRFGLPEKLPAVRFFFVDTDPETLAAAVRSAEGLPALRSDEVFPAKLNRAGHYLKPRLNGRSLIEGWFDSQLLYKIPRSPATMGLRPFGRLAFCDHYRGLTQKFQNELDICTHPDAIADSTERTGLRLRSNRPRVYVIAGLGGATGGGMFIDMAYTARAKLRQMGYADPDVAGVLLLPPDTASDDGAAQVRANAYAALTELNHFVRPDTVFQASYDDRPGVVRDPGPPFTELILLPGPVPTAIPVTPVGAGSIKRSGRVTVGMTTRSGYASYPSQRSGVARATARAGLSGIVGADPIRPGADLTTAGRDPFGLAADLLRLGLTAPVGRILDDQRSDARPGAGAVTFRTYGLAKYDWPRGEVVALTARSVSGVILDHWVSPNYSRARQHIPAWAAEHWARLGLDPDRLIDRLKHAADAAVGQPIEQLAGRVTELLVPRGWRARLPDRSAVTVAFAQLDKLIGTPILTANPPATPVDEAALLACADAITLGQSELTPLFPGLVDDPAFRLAGAEEAVRQMLANIDRGLALFADLTIRYETDARKAYDLLLQCGHHERGGRKVTAADVADAVRNYPRCQYHAVLYRHAVKAYERIKPALVAVLSEVSGCRQRLETSRQLLVGDLEHTRASVGPRQVMPPGCPTIEEAARKFLSVLTDEDLAELEVRIQAVVEQEAGSLYQACLNTTAGTEVLFRAVREESRAYLEARLGEVDFTGMLANQFGGPDGVAEALARAAKDAAPELVGPGPWSRFGVTVIGAPGGGTSDSLRHTAAGFAPPDAPIAAADTPDEFLVCREYSQVPLSALPQCGPAWAAAYEGATEQFQCSPHTRADVTQWVGVDG
jgi:hypothetical protein